VTHNVKNVTLGALPYSQTSILRSLFSIYQGVKVTQLYDSNSKVNEKRIYTVRLPVTSLAFQRSINFLKQGKEEKQFYILLPYSLKMCKIHLPNDFLLFQTKFIFFEDQRLLRINNYFNKTGFI
jgi:hypothetical protein